MNLSLINELDSEKATETFRKCCGSENWAKQMAHARPFSSETELQNRAEDSWKKLSTDDWMQAFDAHPKIGDIESLKKKYGATKGWSENEQSGVNGADEQVINDLAAYNQNYEQKFGYIFIVCATGKSAGEMLSILKDRIVNSPDRELTNAIEEQKKITRIRLEKL
jgi:2-oxo-4-hydroxy-4-carboxy-5-ureidoimidazoline decarboxylase